MTSHLDEGTIHAWLDGALSAAQSAEIEAHVKDCAECSAKVAEARGLIAASSRILVALDDTPANVIPKPTVAPMKQRRSIAPWVSGLAAAAILVTLWRAGDVEHPEPMADLKIPQIPVVAVPQPSLEPLSQPAPPPASRLAVRTDTARQAFQGKVGNVAGAAAAGVATRVGAAGESPARIERTVAAAEQAAPAPLASVAAAEESQRRESSGDSLRRARTASGELAASRTLRSAPASPVTADQATAAESPVRLAGCYRLPTVNRPTDAVTTAVGSAAKAARSAAGAAAPAAQVTRSEAAAPSTLLRLDTLASGQGFAIRDAQTGSARGVWQVLNKDSARVTVPAVGTFTFAVFDKVACPER